MTQLIHIDDETPIEDLLTLLQHVLGAFEKRAGKAALVGMLFGTAVLSVQENAEVFDGQKTN